MKKVLPYLMLVSVLALTTSCAQPVTLEEFLDDAKNVATKVEEVDFAANKLEATNVSESSKGNGDTYKKESKEVVNFRSMSYEKVEKEYKVVSGVKEESNQTTKIYKSGDYYYYEVSGSNIETTKKVYDSSDFGDIADWSEYWNSAYISLVGRIKSNNIFYLNAEYIVPEGEGYNVSSEYKSDKKGSLSYKISGENTSIKDKASVEARYENYLLTYFHLEATSGSEKTSDTLAYKYSF